MKEADVDVTITVADVTMAAITDGVSVAEITPAAISCGSSFCCVCAEITAVDATMAAATATAVGSSSFCFCCATTAVAADADNFLFRQRAVPSAFLLMGNKYLPMISANSSLKRKVSTYRTYFLYFVFMPCFRIPDTFFFI